MKSWTNGLILLSLLVAVLCSYFLYREFTARIYKSGGEVIGTVTFKKRSASRRYTENVIWEDIAQESEIYNYDAIRTMEYSAAVISLKDGTKIELDQNTMLVVILSEKGLDINFDRGGVSARSGGTGSSPITLNSRDARIALDSGDISVNSSEKGMDIVMNSGSAKVASGGTDINISPDVITTLKNGVVESKKGSLFPESPRNNSYMVSFGSDIPVSLSWKCDPPGDVRVDISDSSSFKNMLRSFTTDKTEEKVSLGPGDYYWRIARGDNSSQGVKFTILSDRRPDLTAPRMNEKIVLPDGEGAVTFRWEKSQYASMYEITAARDEKMTNAVLKLTSRINMISTYELEAGTYYWTAKSIYPPGMIPGSTMSGPGRFTMERRSFSMLKPLPLDQGPVIVGTPFSLIWRGVQGAKSYKADLAFDPDFKRIVLSGDTKNSYMKIENKLPEGKYYWRVSAFNGSITSGYSEIAMLRVTRPATIFALFPHDGAVLPERPAEIKYTWNDPNNGSSYIVEISDRSDFRNIKQSLESSVAGITAVSPGVGIHYWRVRLVDEKGFPVARSAATEFSIPATLKVPVHITPGENEKLIPGLIKRIRFQWSRITGANEYEIEITRLIGGVEKPLVIYTSRDDFIEVSNVSMYKPGRYSWLVRAKHVKNGKVTAYQESKKRIFEIDTVELLPPPEVKNPGVLFY